MVYKDTIGVGNAHSDRIDVRRHDDSDGDTVLVVDNPHNVSGLSVEFGARVHPVEAVMISIIEVNKTA